MIAGMSIADERKQIFDFSDPYFDSGVQMAVAEGDSAIAGYMDLRGETVVAKRGSEGETFANSIKDEYGFTVKALADSATMYDDVKAGNSVAVFDDYPVLAYGINQNNGLTSVTEKEQGSSYGFAVIGFAELIYQGQQIYAANFRTGETLLIVVALYFVVITLLTTLSNTLDKRFNK
ncbi:extracellular solute-binding protein (family 3) [Cryobacterium psychrophilum]|nr:extracellular solute-binding protein (family 3) [Cryobacterium psychrophilum]